MPCRRAIQSIHVRRVRVVGSVTIPPVRSAATAAAAAVRARPPTTRRIFPLTGQGQRTRAEGGSIGCHAGVTCLESSRQATPRWAEAADHHVLSAALPAICTEPLERGGDGDVTGSQLPSSACYTTPRAVQLQGQGAQDADLDRSTCHARALTHAAIPPHRTLSPTKKGRSDERDPQQVRPRVLVVLRP